MREAQSWEKMIKSMKGGSIESAWSKEVKRYEQRVIKDAFTVTFNLVPCCLLLTN